MRPQRLNPPRCCLPEIIFNRIAFPLQMLASRVGEGVIAASGVPVLREGNVLMLPGRTLEVAKASSGIRSLITLLMIAITVARDVLRRRPEADDTLGWVYLKKGQARRPSLPSSARANALRRTRCITNISASRT